MDQARTTLYLRGMPVGLVREAKARAAHRGCTVAEVVCAALTRDLTKESLRAQLAADSTETGAELSAAMVWFEKHRDSLRRKHPGEFLAIVGEKVVGHDRDFEALASRVFERYGVRSILMPHVDQDERPARIRSPRRVSV